ncbi:MAG: D-aminoacyl-tRNA deacylase [bacterium]|nr:D-aminoacyl-tRNA deacylase [bacterium]
MRVLVQRSKSSSVLVDDKVVGKIDFGYVLLVGFTDTDTKEKIDKMVRKILHLRIFDDNNGVMNESILDHNGSILLVSQFTLYADAKKGNRPSYIKALNSEDAIKLYDYFNQELGKYIKVETGVFGADMQVNITNDGPITILLEE